ncbi:MAG: hypothetical protein R3A48_03525 [Polyangiales bacterium]
MNRFWTVFLCGALTSAVSACGDSNNTTDAGATPTDVVTAGDSATTGDGGGCATTAIATMNMCYTEEGCASLCPTQRFANNAMTPSWRITALTVAEPAALASPLILGVINPPLRDGKFLWGLSFNFTNNTFRTGPLNRMFTRGTTGAGLMDGTFAYYNNNAPMPGDANRWDPASGAITGTTTVSSMTDMANVRLPIFNDDGSILVELPLANARLNMVPVSADRGCIGLGRLRAGRYNECSSDWETDMGGTVEAAITVSAARGITVSALNQTLCQLLSGTSCDMPQMMWMRQPNAMVGTEPAYRLVARFSAISANVQ